VLAAFQADSPRPQDAQEDGAPCRGLQGRPPGDGGRAV